MKIFKIIGQPGTGKTTRILQLIEQASKKYSPDEIGAVSHTNAAVKEMRQRLIDSTGAKEADISHVRTMHSQCYRLLGLDPSKVADKRIKDFNLFMEDLGMGRLCLSSSQIKEEEDEEEINPEIIQNQKNFHRMMINRNKMIPMSDWEPEVQNIWAAWSTFMESNDMVDFTRMLEQILERDLCPPIKCLFVDEAQDLTRLQLEVALRWCRKIEATTFVGDSDQSIYRFAGATPEIFRDLRHDWGEVLKQSYRVPPAVHRFSMDILRRIKDRENVEYLPRLDRGEGRVVSVLRPDFSLPGSHMIICRCNFRIPYWQDVLNQEGLTWWNPYRLEDKSWNPQECGEYKAIMSYQKLIQNETISGEEFDNFVEHMISQGNLVRGAKKEIKAAEFEKRAAPMSRADIGFLPWFLPEFLLWKTGVKDVIRVKTKAGSIGLLDASNEVRSKPVILGTIHSVKGGEADNVWIDTVKSRRILREMKKSEQVRYDEDRIFYVAVTRSRQVVGILRRR
uniref:DNA 3'-5' helicase n=1 Tax=viral metagenome TaxID=1070528 RepID=A0A6M3K5I0_9ZZZZ